MVIEISDGNIMVSGMSDDVTRIIPLMTVASNRVLLGYDDDVMTLASILAMNDTGATGSDGNRNVWTSAYEQTIKDNSTIQLTVCDMNGTPVDDGHAATRTGLGIPDVPQLPDGVDSTEVASMLAQYSDQLSSMRDSFIQQCVAMVEKK